MPASERQVALPLYRTERVIASMTTAWVVILTTYMVFQNHELSQTSIYFLKIILSMSGGVMLATMPGFFDVNYSLGGFSVRAAGGAAAFVFIYTQSPSVPSLKLDQAARPPAAHEQPARPKSGDQTSAIKDSYPSLVMLSFAPMVILPEAAQPAYQPDADDGRTSGGDVNAGGGSDDAGVDAGGGVAAGDGRISIGEAVTADVDAIYSVAADYVSAAFTKLGTALDAAAEIIRKTVGKLVAATGRLLGLTASEPELLPTLGVMTEDLTERLDPLTDSLLDSGTAPLTTVLSELNDLGSDLTGDLGNAVTGIVSATDRTVQTLTTTTQHLLTGVTGMLNQTTGELTSGLTAPVDKLVQTVTTTTDKLVDTVVPKATETVSHVLSGVNTGLSKVTEQVNAVSPAIISHIDPDFAALQNVETLAKVNKLADGNLLPEKLDSVLNKPLGLAGDLADLRSTNSIVSKALSDPLGGEPLSVAPTRVTNLTSTGQSVLSPLSGSINDVTSGLRSTSTSLLGGSTLSGTDTSSPVSGVTGITTTSSGSGSTVSGGSALSSTLGTTSSIVGGTLKGLSRR